MVMITDNMKNLKDSFIIEFNGMPGSGKTTSASLLSKKFMSKGYEVVEYNCFVEKDINSKLIKIFEIIRWCKFKYLWRMLCFLWSIRPIKKFHIKYALFGLNYLGSYCKFTSSKKDKRVMIVDQGIIQSIISAVYLKSIKDSNSLKNLLKCIPECTGIFISVNCIADERTSKDRIVLRNQSYGRFDRMSEKDLLKNLKTQKDNFEIIRKCMLDTKEMRCINIDMKKNSQSNNELLYDLIFQKTRGELYE